MTTVRTRELYASPNGDRWYLALEPRSGRVFIRHEPNAASGGGMSLIGVTEFLAQGGGHGPQHAELLRLIGALVRNDPAADTPAVDAPPARTRPGGSDAPPADTGRVPAEATSLPTSVALRHRTTYRYERPITLGPQTIRLRPAPHARAPVLSYALAVLPEAHAVHWFQDPQGNFVARVLLAGPTALFEIAVELRAELAEVDPFDFVLEPEAATWPFRYPAPLEQELTPYRVTEPIQPWLASLLAGLPLGEQPSVELLVALNRLVRDRVAYLTRMEPGVQAPEQTLGRGSGSCRDVAWLLVRAARSLGFAARFASGYLIQLTDPERPVPGIEADGADLHAWAEVYLPGAGWIGFDATSGLITGAGHIPLASGAHPASAAPVSGTVEAGAAARLGVETTVTRLPMSPACPVP